MKALSVNCTLAWLAPKVAGQSCIDGRQMVMASRPKASWAIRLAVSQGERRGAGSEAAVMEGRRASLPGHGRVLLFDHGAGTCARTRLPLIRMGEAAHPGAALTGIRGHAHVCSAPASGV